MAARPAAPTISAPLPTSRAHQGGLSRRGLRWPTPPSSKDVLEVVGVERGYAGEVDLEIGMGEVSVDVALKQMMGGVKAEHADDAVVRRMVGGEGVTADEDEGLLVRVDEIGVH